MPHIQVGHGSDVSFEANEKTSSITESGQIAGSKFFALKYFGASRFSHHAYNSFLCMIVLLLAFINAFILQHGDFFSKTRI